MKTVCGLNTCVGCMACVDICPKQAITIKDNLTDYNAVINETLCVNCYLCHNVCQNNYNVKLMTPILWRQGWANDKDIRLKASSGGLATAISKAFIENGGVVYGCTYQKGRFLFDKAETAEEINKFVGSKYVKSNPCGVFRRVLSDLKEGIKVLFIGLPCQVAALKGYIKPELQNSLYTVDLICHGTPSPKLLDKYFIDNKVDMSKAEFVSFRYKTCKETEKEQKNFSHYSDRYSIAFLNGLNYTENCYHCRYACEDRVSDLTLGDSWGSELLSEEVKRGISLVLCQDSKGQELLSISNLYLTDVDPQKAKEHNHQLVAPSNKLKEREKFFALVNKGVKFNKAVFKCLPKPCFKQLVKKYLLKLHIYTVGGVPYSKLIYVVQEKNNTYK